MIFPSQEWFAALVEAVNQQPDLAQALRGLGQDAAFVIEADPPALRKTLVVYGRHENGRIVGVRLLPDPDDILELEPAYVFSGRYRAWKVILLSDDPMRAAIMGKVRVKGDLESLVRHLNYRHVVEKAVASVKTEFQTRA